MTFLSMNIQKICMTQQKSLLEYQEVCISAQKNKITEEMSDYEINGGSDDDAYYAQLEAYNEVYDTQQASIESQLELINSQLESFQKAIETNIKSECKLSISV